MTTPHNFSPVETAAAGTFCTSGQRPIRNDEKVEVGGVMVDIIMKFNSNVNVQFSDGLMTLAVLRRIAVIIEYCIKFADTFLCIFRRVRKVANSDN